MSNPATQTSECDGTCVFGFLGTEVIPLQEGSITRADIYTYTEFVTLLGDECNVRPCSCNREDTL